MPDPAMPPADTDPAPRLAGRSPLPRPLTSFVGREDELAAIEALLARDDVQLVTLTGPGGVGKSRLVLQIAKRPRQAFADGTVVVALAAVRDPQLVLPVIVRHLMPETSDRDRPADWLIAFLADRQMLLVLDNFEQVIEAGPALIPVLEQSPRVKVLITSRAQLRLSGEHAIAISPLSVDSVDGTTPSAAVRLFVARADAVRPGFADNPADAATMTGICRRLDGLPLAIELAAARVAHLSPRALLARLEPSLPLLTGGGRDLPQRQQTVRATISWSYELLPPDVQRSFRWLAVFIGGFTLEAAEAVCEAAGDGADALAGIAALLDHSLLRLMAGSGAEPRYVMLETIREFGVEQLEARGETAAAQRARARYFLAKAEQSGRLPTIPWLDQMEAERGNLDATLRWLTESREDELLLRLVAALGSFWDARGPIASELSWMDSALALASSEPSAVRIKALCWAGLLERARGNIDRAIEREEEALSHARVLGDPGALADALHSLGQVLLSRGELARATACFEESIELFRGLDDGPWAFPILNLGIMATQQGDTARARDLLEIAVAELRRTGHKWGAGFALRALADVARAEGDLVRARDIYAESISLWRGYGSARGFARGIAYAVIGLLATDHVWQQPRRAARVIGAAEKISEVYGLSLWATELAAYERTKAEVARLLGAAELAGAQDEGARLTLDEAATEAIALTAPAEASEPAPSRDSAALTPREHDVLRLVIEGKSDREIAAALSLSRRTVESHVFHILTKLNVGTRTAAATYAVRHGLV